MVNRIPERRRQILMTKVIRAPRLVVLVALTALAALALATAGSVAAAPGKGKAKGHTKGYKVSRGATTLSLDQAVVDGLTASGTTLSVNKPAKTTDDGTAFPITNGRVKVTKDGTGAITAATGKINHTGGLTLTKGDSTIVLRNLRIVLDDAPDLTAAVSVNGSEFSRVSIADLEVDLSQIATSTTGTKKHPKRWLTVDDVVVSLNQTSVDALNATFGTTFSAGDQLGTADVKTRIVGRFPA